MCLEKVVWSFKFTSAYGFSSFFFFRQYIRCRNVHAGTGTDGSNTIQVKANGIIRQKNNKVYVFLTIHLFYFFFNRGHCPKRVL